MNKCVFDFGDRCKCLKVKECSGCHFYKTEEQLNEGRDKATVRVAGLAPKPRHHIRNKYYGGRSVFKDE